VIRDTDGSFVAAQSKTCTGKFSPAAVEAMAAMVAMELCRELGLIHVYLEGDAKTIIDTINHEEAD
jgi:ribonuclease HI